SVVASAFMVNVLPHQGRTWLETAIVVFFGALFGWIAIGFWTATLGFLTLLRRDRFAITRLDSPPGRIPSTHANPRGDEHGAGRTAITMRTCAEPVERVFAGLRSIYRSLERIQAERRFHFYILSDTRDPGTAIREEQAWFEWCR